MDYFVKDYPAAVAVLDDRLKIINYSQIWLEEFECQDTDLLGQKLVDVLDHIPIELKNDLNKSLKGKRISSPATKFTTKGNAIKWLKWKTSPILDDTKKIGGIVLLLEDVTNYERNKELFLKGELVSKTGSWELNLLSNELYWSPMTKIIHELPLSYIPNLEEGINFYKEGEHRDNITALVSNAIAEGTNWDTELILVTAKGNEKWVRAKGEVECIDGKKLRIIGTFQDIDNKKKDELKYRETSERLKIATNAAKIGIWEFDIKNNKLVWDKNMFDLYGIKKEKFTGVYEAWESVVHNDDKERAQSEITTAISNENMFNSEFRIVWPNGNVRNIRAIANTERDANGKGIKLIGVNWDVTELTNAQSKLYQSEKSIASAFENSVIGMAYLDLDYKFIKLNKSLCNTLGYSEKELVNLNFQHLTHEEDLQKTLNLFNKINQGKTDSFQLEKRYYHKNKSIINTIKTVTVVKNLDGGISHYISQVLNITPRIEAEKRLQELLKVTKDQNSSLTNFAHIVSHNLRSHATNMSMLTKFLIQENDEKERENITTMLVNAADSLDETILHLNDVVQVKTGALEKIQSVNVLSCLLKIEKSIEGLLLQKKAKTKIFVNKSDFVMVVPAYIESIFFNLYTNSLKYSSPLRKPNIEISAKTQSGITTIVFKDNGIGIDMNRHADKIFGMYKTFHKHKDSKGIGLFITKNQIEAMGGTINVESEINKGTTFYITLKQA
ncbi:PAS domain S-box protein [Maribacter sp. CXY002]|uniref:PAS domain-containing sensor histidine kinase n=1 Tax=Maribacter luteocoastalis TaxID=3407671 RepID=UPI003B66FC1A